MPSGQVRKRSVYKQRGIKEELIMDANQTTEQALVIDYADAMDRFGDNEALYKRLAGKFTTDTHFAELEEALACNDLDAAYRAAHSLKGVAGNLSFAQLYQLASIVSKALETGDRATADEYIGQVKDAYLAVLDALVDLEAASN